MQNGELTFFQIWFNKKSGKTELRVKLLKMFSYSDYNFDYKNQ